MDELNSVFLVFSPNPFGTTEDQDFRLMFRPQPVVKVKEEIVEEEQCDSTPVQSAPAVVAAREKTPTRPISPAVQQILATASAVAATKAPVTGSSSTTTTTAPLANIRISIDAPELPDHSLKTLVAHRDSILQRAEQQLKDGQITNLQYNDIMRDFNTMLDEAQFGNGKGPGGLAKVSSSAAGLNRLALMGSESFPPSVSSQVRPSVTASASIGQSSQVTTTAGRDSTAFDPIPANNRIFVDGRAYEVRYIDDVAVIERNGLPHRIYFVGTPRDVVVDGFAHTLAFGESKTITIDGQAHVIRFGAPSRELYMGKWILLFPGGRDGANYVLFRSVSVPRFVRRTTDSCYNQRRSAQDPVMRAAARSQDRSRTGLRIASLREREPHVSIGTSLRLPEWSRWPD